MKMLLRRTMLLKRASQSREAIEEKSNAIEHRLLELPEWKRASTVMLYASTRSEVQTKDLIEKTLEQGKRVCLPVRMNEEHVMKAYYINSLGELVLGDLGYLEPSKEKGWLAEPHEIDLVVAPGIAFDERGHRLGRGMHYYDTFLSKVKCKKIALAFELQLVDKVPTEPHDVPVDKIVTEKRVINCTKL